MVMKVEQKHSGMASGQLSSLNKHLENTWNTFEASFNRIIVKYFRSFAFSSFRIEIEMNRIETLEIFMLKELCYRLTADSAMHSQ